jgi:hypothetical protein
MVGYITKLTKEKIKYIYIYIYQCFFCEWGWVYFCNLANFHNLAKKKKKEKANEGAKGTKGLFLGGRKWAQFAIFKENR